MDREVNFDLDRLQISRSLFGYNRRQVDQYFGLFRDQILSYKARLRDLESGAQHPAAIASPFTDAPTQETAVPEEATTVTEEVAAPVVVEVAQPIAEPEPEPEPAPEPEPEPEPAKPVEPAKPTAAEESMMMMFTVAHREAEDIKTRAQREATTLIDEARQKAEEQSRAARTDLSQLKWDIERLRLEKQRLLEEYRSFLEGRLSELSGAAAPEKAPKFKQPTITAEELEALQRADPE